MRHAARKLTRRIVVTVFAFIFGVFQVKEVVLLLMCYFFLVLSAIAIKRFLITLLNTDTLLHSLS